ncbi:MAG: sensor histidine kinase [Saprospiraceae bacterium]
MLQTLLSGRGRLITHLVGWSLVFFIFFYLISGMRGTGEAFVRAGINLLFLIVLFYGNAKFLVNRFFESGRYGIWIALTLVFWVSMAALRAWVEIEGFGGSLFSMAGVSSRNGGILRVFLGYALSFLLLLVFSGFYQLLENRRELEARHAEAQLNYLKAQINPHFLFNTLNNIYAAATLQHPRTADMVLRLSDLLRYVTYDGQAQRVPLSKEIAQIRAYIELFQLKSESLLPITFELEGDTESRQIEPLLLLPLVENALKHGDLEQNPDGFLRILLRNDPARFTFLVENSFDPDNQQKDEQGGVGLENIRQRLALDHQGRSQFRTQIEGRKFRAELAMDYLG